MGGFGDVCNKVMVGVGYVVGIGRSLEVGWVVYEVGEVWVRRLVDDGLDGVVCEDGVEECKGLDGVKGWVKGVGGYVRNEFDMGG